MLICGSLLSNEEMVQGLLFEPYLLQYACVVSNRTSKECHTQYISSIFVGICVPVILKSSKLALFTSHCAVIEYLSRSIGYHAQQ